VAGLIDEFLPDEMALEAPFYGKNVQSMLKLGRAQGVAMAAALSRDIPIAEYVPMRVKQAITGTGQASKEQVATMLQRVLRIPAELMPEKLDATDGLAVAYCHFLQTSNAVATSNESAKSWKEFIKANPNKVHGLQAKQNNIHNGTYDLNPQTTHTPLLLPLWRTAPISAARDRANGSSRHLGGYPASLRLGATAPLQHLQGSARACLLHDG